MSSRRPETTLHAAPASADPARSYAPPTVFVIGAAHVLTLGPHGGHASDFAFPHDHGPFAHHGSAG